MAASQTVFPATPATALPKNSTLQLSSRATLLCKSSSSICPRPISLSYTFGGWRTRFVERNCVAVEGTETVAAEGTETVAAEESVEDGRRKLYVVNLPWNFTAPEMRELFGQCGTVTDVEIIKQKGGRGRGFAFITMSSSEEARAVIEKFDSYELQERIIRVEFAKGMKKPARPAVPDAESRHKIYVSNLAWKVRSNNLKEFFTGKFNPLSARVVFDTPSGRAAGYGFVSFSTEEEMANAISEFDGKELMGRPIRLKVSERKRELTEEV